MNKLLIALCLAALLPACGSTEPDSSEVESGYPSNYPIFSDVRAAEKVAVTRSLQSDGGIGLWIEYGGHLRGSSGLKVYVKVNYLDGSRDLLVPLDSDTGSAARFRLSSRCLVGEYGGCARQAPDSMKHLLYWAVGTRRLNALDMELAFTNDQGEWDSKYGANYRVQFGEVTPY